MTVYQEPGTERTVDVDEEDGELLLALGWTVAPPTTDDALAASLASEGEPEPEPEPVKAKGRRGAPRADDLIGE